MERNIVTTVVVPAASLEGKEGYAVDVSGTLSSSKTKACLGVVKQGRPANEASTVIQRGMCEAQVNGSTTAIAAGDPLVAGSGGVFVKAALGTDFVQAYAYEAASSATTINIELL